MQLLANLSTTTRTKCLFLLLLVAEQFIFWQGRHWWGSAFNPLPLMLISAAVGYYYLHLTRIYVPLFVSSQTAKLSTFVRTQTAAQSQRLIWAFWGFASICILPFLPLDSLFQRYPPDYNSDVLIVMEELANRFFKGEFPYSPILCKNEYYVNAPYLPAFWLPMLGSLWAGIDERWSGYIVWGIVMAIFGWLFSKHTTNKWLNFFCIGLFSSIIWIYYLKDGSFSLSSTYESVIIAYYLLLLIGIYYDSLWITTLALLLCLLSRYNLLFWLPILGILYLKNRPLSDIIKLCLGVGIGILVLYVFPFLLKSPDIFFKSYGQWVTAAEENWSNALMIPPDKRIFEMGRCFNTAFYEWGQGTILSRIMLMQRVQLGLVLLFSIGTMGYYFKQKNRFTYPDYAIATLKIYFAIFFAFSPMVFEYYFMPSFAISIFLFVQILGRLEGEINT